MPEHVNNAATMLQPILPEYMCFVGRQNCAIWYWQKHFAQCVEKFCIWNIAREIENNEGRQQYCAQYYLQAGWHTAQGVPTPPHIGQRAHPLLSTSQGYYIFTHFSFNLHFGAFFCYNFAHFLFKYILTILFHFLAHPLMPFYASHSYLVFHIIFDTSWSAIHAYILHDVISFVLRPWEILILLDIFI